MSVNFDNSCIHIFSTAEVKICKIIQTILEIIQKSQRIFFFFFFFFLHTKHLKKFTINSMSPIVSI
jgi:hypothetical protein